MMLGYMEQQVLYNAINFTYGPSQSVTQYAWAVNQTVIAVHLSVMLCPSDGVSGPTIFQSGNTIYYFDCNYAGSCGTTINNTGTPQQDVALQASTGVFGCDNQTMHNVPAYTMASVTDGSSNTIAFGERLVGGGTTNYTNAFRTSVEGVTAVAGVVAVDPSPQFTAVVQALGVCAAAASTAMRTQTGGNTYSGSPNFLFGVHRHHTLQHHRAPEQYAIRVFYVRVSERSHLRARGLCQCEQQPPRRRQLLFRRRQRALPQEQYEHADVLVTRDQGGRGGY